MLAGPVEATAIGNLLVQAQAAGVVPPGLAALRSVVAASSTTVRHGPGGDPAPWDAAERRLHG